MKALLTILVAALLAAGCSIHCIHATGPVQQRSMQVPAFNALEVDGSIDVTIEKGNVQEVTVSAQQDLFALLDTTVSGSTWKIRTSKCWSSSSGYKVHIITPAPLVAIAVSGSSDVTAADVFGTEKTELTVSGSGSIAVAEINAKKLELAIAGSGSITVRGTCSEMEADLAGSGVLEAMDLAANTASVSVSGSGNATVKAISRLQADVSGSGTIRYGGKPDLRSKISGSGSVMPIQ